MRSARRQSMPMTLEEYFAFDEQHEGRFEYVGGYVYECVGGTRSHERIVSNLTGFLWNALGEGPCVVFANGRKVMAARDVFIPDVMVVCSSDAAVEEALTEHAPCLVAEVASRSTERIDRGEKRRGYTALSSMVDYLLVSQFEARIDCHQRLPDGSWQLRSYVGTDEVPLASLGIALPLDVVYRGVEFPPPRPPLRLGESAREWPDDDEEAELG